MALSYGEGLYGDAVGVVTPLDHRLAQIGGYTKTTTANVIRAGIFYNGTSDIVSGAANMSYNVAAFSAVSTRGATQGVVPFANDATANVVTTAAPGSNSRYDVVYAWPRDFAIDGSNSTPVLGVENGVAAASPTVPSIAAYPGAIELARILVPSGVTATNSGTTFTQTAPFTSVDGGVVPFRNTTAMDLWTTALTGQRASDLSTGITYKWDGAAWLADTTAWVNPTLLNSWVVNGGLTISYRRLNGVVYGRGQGTGGGAGTVIYQLPAGFRPAQTHKSATTNTDGTSSYRLQITTGGDVSVSNAGASATPVIEFSFPV